MDKRALIAVVLSLVILVVYQEVILRHWYPALPPQDVGVLPSSEDQARRQPEAAPPPEVAAPEAIEATAPKAGTGEARHITVDTDHYTALFTTAGARLESLRLKQYRTTVDPNSPPQEAIVPGQGRALPFGVELRGARPLSDRGAPYAVDGGDLTLRGDENGSLSFTWRGESGTVTKRFSFRGDRYEFQLAVEARDVPREFVEIGLEWSKTVEAQPQPGSEIIFDRTIYLDGRKFFEHPFDNLTDGKVVAGQIGWAGYAGKHFVAAMIPAAAENQRLWLKLRDQTVQQQLLFPLADGAATQALDVYVGPKDFDVLGEVGHNLSRAVNLGWFEFIAVPLLHLLKMSYRYTANYGVSIIILTMLIKVLFIPLTQRSFRSMREMQKLQPQMAQIREKHKDDSETMNKEIMELYRRHKVNPLGGCLPMVLQIPVFIGLYNALLNSVEMRHAPFMWWITDLSAPDRLGALQIPFVQGAGVPVLTLVMGASMFVQQWMTPAAGDPAQQRIMMIMPLMFTFMFVNFPSGLVLYWLVNNVLTIAQQAYMTRSST